MPTNEFCNKLVPSFSLVVIHKAQIASLAMGLEREKKSVINKKL